MSEPQVHLNGKIVPLSEARIGVCDSGLLHGASAFTTMLAHNGVVFRLDRHLRRLLETVAFLEMRTDATAETLTRAVDELLEANALTEARMRITLTPGSVRGGGATTLITADPLPDYPPQWYSEGITVVVSSFRQAVGDPTFGHKTGCYLPRVLGMREAAAKGAQEALWYTADQRLAEGCFTNVFCVLEGKVHTPPRDTPVLPGIVRQAVLELCEQLEIESDDQRALNVHDMLGADEIFVTGSCSGVRPVARVEAHRVGDGRAGEVTGKLMAAYRELLDRECPPRPNEDTT